MSKDLNQCNFIGRLGKDPELKYMSNGNPVVKFSIACGDDYKDKNGQLVQRTNWVNITIFGKLAEIAGEYLKKGSQVYISGKQVTNKWQDQSGQDRYTTEIVANDMQMLGGRQGSQSAPNGQQPMQQPAQHQNTNDEFIDDEIPF